MMETPGAGKGKPRPMLDVKTQGTFDSLIQSNYGKTPKRSRLTEMVAGAMHQHVNDQTFLGMFGKDDYV